MTNDPVKDWNELPLFETSRSRLEIPFEEALKNRMSLAEAFAHKQFRYKEQKHVTGPASLATPRDPNDAAGIPIQQPYVMIASPATRTALHVLLPSNRPNSSHPVRRPELRLVSHLHEHNESVIQSVYLIALFTLYVYPV